MLSNCKYSTKYVPKYVFIIIIEDFLYLYIHFKQFKALSETMDTMVLQ